MHRCCSFREHERKKDDYLLPCSVLSEDSIFHTISHMFLLVLLISLGSGVFVLHFNNVLGSREGEIGILRLVLIFIEHSPSLALPVLVALSPPPFIFLSASCQRWQDARRQLGQQQQWSKGGKNNLKERRAGREQREN